jgi:hypothetical protein
VVLVLALVKMHKMAVVLAVDQSTQPLLLAQQDKAITVVRVQVIFQVQAEAALELQVEMQQATQLQATAEQDHQLIHRGDWQLRQVKTSLELFIMQAAAVVVKMQLAAVLRQVAQAVAARVLMFRMV